MQEIGYLVQNKNKAKSTKKCAFFVAIKIAKNLAKNSIM